MKNKIIVLLIIATVGLSIGFGTSLYQRNEAETQLSIVQSEATSLQDALNQKEADLQKKIDKNKELKAELKEANQVIEDLKGSEYKLVYLGDFKYTYYCDERRPHICGGSGVTASGVSTQVGTTVAVDRSVIPLGTTVYIEGVGFRVAQDTGGWVEGKHVDILVKTHNEALSKTLVRGGVWILVKNS